MRVPFETLKQELGQALTAKGFAVVRAAECARLFAEASLDGVASHGLNRFPRFLAMIENGAVDIYAEPKCTAALGGIEQWDGRKGPGNLNAAAAMRRAVQLAAEHGAGVVAMRNTNHWMRGGAYGWQAAEAGYIGICWTNTNQNLPPWGGSEARIGNNPLIIAIPRKEGHFVLDMAMSQFSYGALASYRKAGKMLPVPGGYDQTGEITQDPAEIETTWRALPVGFWKGSALSIVLDAAAAALSNGNATHQISQDPLQETGLSQVFIALSVITNSETADAILDQIASHLHESPALENEHVYYPGERTLMKRRENLEKGVPVDPEIWASVREMNRT